MRSAATAMSARPAAEAPTPMPALAPVERLLLAGVEVTGEDEVDVVTVAVSAVRCEERGLGLVDSVEITRRELDDVVEVSELVNGTSVVYATGAGIEAVEELDGEVVVVLGLSSSLALSKAMYTPWTASTA